MKIQRNVSSYNMKIKNYKNIMKFWFSDKNNVKAFSSVNVENKSLCTKF